MIKIVKNQSINRVQHSFGYLNLNQKRLFSLVLRGIIGEPTIGLPSIVNVYKNKDRAKNLIFPAKTVLMFISLVTLITVSHVRKKLRKLDTNSKEQNDAFYSDIPLR